MSNTEITADLSTDDRAELERLRAEATKTTRELSPKKPEDHQAPIKKPVTVTFKGETFTFDRRAAKHHPNFMLLRANDSEGYLTALLGTDGLAKALKAVEDEDGFQDEEVLGELIQALIEGAGAKNS